VFHLSHYLISDITMQSKIFDNTHWRIFAAKIRSEHNCLHKSSSPRA